MVRVVLLLITIFVLADNANREQGRFKYKNESYSYSLNFSTNLHKDSVLAVLYSFDHLKKYSSGTSETRFLGKNKENCYEIEILLKHLFYATRSVYKRTFLPDSGVIKIELQKFESNSTIFPSIVHSFSEYRVFSDGTKTVIQYRQTVSFNKKLNRFYLKIIRTRLDEFAEDLTGYIKNLSGKTEFSAQMEAEIVCTVDCTYGDELKP